MKTIFVPASLTVSVPKTQRQVDAAEWLRVPVLHRFGGLAVTPSVGAWARAGFTITHINTGLAVPSLCGLTYETALVVAPLLAEAFNWAAAKGVFFVRSLSPSHLEDLRGCIIAIREMFGIE